MEKIEEENGRRIMKRFSIIMAAYNAEKEIENAIKSVLNQTFKNFELLMMLLQILLLKLFQDMVMLN